VSGTVTRSGVTHAFRAEMSDDGELLTCEIE
jgi:hypothetical protein